MTIKTVYFFMLVLVGLKASASFYTTFSLYGDESQYWLWAQTIDFGYFSKPPLLAWFLSIHTMVFGNSFISLKMFPIIVYFLIALAIYRFCLQLSFNKKSALFCSLNFLIIPAASISSFLISTDLLLLLFWTLAMTKLLEIRDNQSTIKFFLFGLFVGLAFLSKYAGVYFLLSFLILLILDKKTFEVFYKNFFGSIIFVLLFVLVISPNIYWNINNGWVTFSHTVDNANLKNLKLNFYEPLKFFIAQTLMIGPMLFVFFIYMIRSFRLDFGNKFLLIFSLPVLIIVLVESFLVRANANWAAPALISVFILFFRLIDNKKRNLISINFLVNYVIGVFLFLSILTSSENKIFDRIRGVNVFANEVQTIIGDKDLVVSDRIIFSNISYELRNETNKLYMPHKSGSIITNHFQISSPLNKKRDNSFYLIGNLSDISYLSKQNNAKLVKEFVVPFSSGRLKLYEISFN